MRTKQAADFIKIRIIEPYSLEAFISERDVAYLIALFESQKTAPNAVYKNTGPITIDINNFSEDPVITNVIKKLKEELGPFEITAGFFFTTNYPHIIHNDDTFELPDEVYRGITLPLQITRTSGEELPRLCFFDQFYLHGPAKFFNGDTDMATYYNKQVYEYSDVDGLVNTDIVDTDQLLTHLKPSWLKGLSLHSSLEWRPGNALIFDSVRLHCASDFRRLNIKSKLAISIFTKL